MEEGILKKFIYLFITDASSVKKGADDAEKATKNLQNTLISTDAITNKLNQSFLGFAKRAGGFLAAMAGVGAIIHKVKSSISLADEFGRFSEFTGIAVEDLAAFGFSVEKSGGTIQGFLGTVKSLSADLANLSTKGKSNLLPFFNELGIKVTDSRGKVKPILDLLPQLAGAFEKVSAVKSFGIGQKLGLDEGTINLLQKGRKEVEEFIRREKELGIFTKQNAELAKKFNEQWFNTQHIFQALSARIATTLLPVLTSFGRGIELVGKFISDNSDLIEGALIAISVVIFTAVLPAIVSMIVAFAPFIGVIAILTAIGTAFALLHEDIQFFRRGQDSLIGETLKKWPLIGDIFKGLAATISFLWDVYSGFIHFLINSITSPTEAWKEFKKIISGAFNTLIEKMPWLGKVIDAIGQRFSDIFNSLKQDIISIFDFIGNLVNKIKGAIDTVVNGYKKVKEFLGFGDSEIKTAHAATQQRLTEANSSPFNSAAISSISNSSKALTRNTSVNTGPITVNTQATDGVAVAQDLSSSLDREIRQAMDYATDGVMA